MSDSDTLAQATVESVTTAETTAKVPTYARVLPIVSLYSSIFFAALTVVTCIAILTVPGYDVIFWLIIGLPASLGGSSLLALVPAVILRLCLPDRRVTWSLRISAAAVVLGGGMWIFIAALF